MNNKNWEEFLKTHLQTGLLIVAAFVIGYLFAQVRMKDTATPTGQVAAQNQNGQAAQAGEQVTLSSILDQAKVDTKKVMACVNNGDQTDNVQAQLKAGQAAGVRGTPGNYIVLEDGQGEAIPGALPYEQLQPIIDAYVNQGSTEKTVALADLPAVGEEDEIRGDQNATVTVIEYSDYDCPYCSRFHETMKQILDEYSGQVRWVYRQFPLVQLHPNAPKLSEAAECVSTLEGEEAFWRFSDVYFQAKAAGKQVSIK